jgi:aromatic-L-amino-acid decarboxylase
MARILVVTWDGGGNVPPMLGVASELLRRGHQVRVLGNPQQREAVVRDRVSRHCSFARRVFELASADERLEPLTRPTLSICCYRYRAPDATGSELDHLNIEIAQRLRMEGIVPSTMRVDGKYAIRPCFINPRTTIEDVEHLVSRTREIGDALTER